ncbi:adenylyltransferase/cytidyltransferase family protein [Nesterenkonia alkaliphila]|uniref:adenylyltransferase/cytidyltransferase family protein n=1 Tax=Nesterenkonia alkaliphila TaxID=1463631 RepID=UPI0019BC8DC9|nr:hypothetical protein GCM10011359_11830 [Nesterenkonia alkaliphila]
MKRVLTYGTFDLLHWGHIRLLKRAKALGDYLIVGASTDDFAVEHKQVRAPYHQYATRCDMLEAVRYVDLVIEESSWEQKIDDIRRYHVDTVVMGSDWEGSSSSSTSRTIVSWSICRALRGSPPPRSGVICSRMPWGCPPGANVLCVNPPW